MGIRQQGGCHPDEKENTKAHSLPQQGGSRGEVWVAEGGEYAYVGGKKLEV